MWKALIATIALSVAAGAEVHTLNLHQAVQLALKQNGDITLARLEEQKAEEEVRLARSAFVPKVYAGSGLAYSSGFPMSIEGATPSIVQARAVADVFNRPQSYRVAAARENRRAASHDVLAKQEQAAFRTAELFLDAQRAERLEQIARQQVEILEKIRSAVEARVEEGRELPIEAKRAALNVARARYNLLVAEAARRNAENALSLVLGLDPGDQVRCADEEWPAPALPASADAAAEEAVRASKELRALESKLVAQGYEIHAARALRLPRFDLVAQYGLLGRFNNYEEFFRKFERHNGQLGVSIELPLFQGAAVSAQVARAEQQAAELRLNIRATRDRIAADARRLYFEVQQAEAAREVARLDLDLAREQVSLLLAQMSEGRAGLRQVEQARLAESEKWIAFYDAATALDKARLALLHRTGSLLAALAARVP